MAGTPSLRISGCAQWWPVRTQTPSRPSSSPMSCGCMPSSVKLITPPRCSAGGPTTLTPGISAMRGSAYSVSARSWAVMLSMPMSVDVVDRRAEADGLGDRAGAGLELPGQVVPGRVGEVDDLDHVAAAEPRAHLLERLALAVEDADAGRAVGLVAGPDVEVRADRVEVDLDLRDCLRAVDQDRRAGGVGLFGRALRRR